MFIHNCETNRFMLQSRSFNLNHMKIQCVVCGSWVENANENRYGEHDKYIGETVIAEIKHMWQNGNFKSWI